MQLTTITAIFATALSASAAPLDARAAPSVFGHFFTSNSGCQAGQGDTNYDFEFQQDNTGTCHQLIVPFQVVNTKFYNNTLTKPIEFYEQAGCLESSIGHDQITPYGSPGKHDGCENLRILYYKTIV